MSCIIGYFDSAETENRSYLYTEKDGFIYEISFSLGGGSLKNDKALQAEYDEMLGTFGFNQIVDPQNQQDALQLRRFIRSSWR